MGVFTGLLSFYLHENHPKVNRDDDYKLLPLVRWKFSKANVDRNENVKDELEDENLKELIKQFNNTKWCSFDLLFLFIDCQLFGWSIRTKT